MSYRKTLVATILASGIAAASFVATPSIASAAPAKKPEICLFLPLCQEPAVAPAPVAKPKPVHHTMKKSHVVKKAPMTTKKKKT